MKVILLEDVDALGKMGDTVSVKDGYARNYLIPRNLALPATARNVRAQEHQLRDIDRRRTKIVDNARSLADRIAGVSLSFNRKVGEKGRLFGSVTNMDIAEALGEKGLTVDRKDIHLPEPIKSLGEFDVEVKLHHDVAPVVKVTVLPEEGEIPEGALEEASEKDTGPEPIDVAVPEATREAEASLEEAPPAEEEITGEPVEEDNK